MTTWRYIGDNRRWHKKAFGRIMLFATQDDLLACAACLPLNTT